MIIKNKLYYNTVIIIIKFVMTFKGGLIQILAFQILPDSIIIII